MYELMTLRERAERIVGDMPWLTFRLSSKQYLDLIDQIETAFKAVEYQAKLESEQP